MELTGLEVALGGIVVAMGSGVFTAIVQGVRFQTKAECRRQHCIQNEDFEELKKGQRTQFRMLRAIIPHLPIGEKEKVAILNETGGD